MNEMLSPTLLATIDKQAIKPPGNDPVLSGFYTALGKMLHEGSHIVDLFASVQEARPTLTDSHFVSLAWRGLHQVMMDTPNKGYLKCKDPNQWEQYLHELLANKEQAEEWISIIKTKSTSSTIYQRYAGPYSVIAHMYDSMPSWIVDLGCGGNFGLRGLDLQEPFAKVLDYTPGKKVSQLLAEKIHLDKGLAVDKEDPNDPDVKKWRLACSFYPKEQRKVKAYKAFETRLEASKKVVFMKEDLESFVWPIRNFADAVILSTMLYQLQPQQQAEILAKARNLLCKNGVLIVQDFAKKDSSDPTRLDLTNDWSKQSYSYRTFVLSAESGWTFKEALQWNNGRCTSVKPGEDFNWVFSPDRMRNSTGLLRARSAHIVNPEQHPENPLLQFLPQVDHCA